MVATPEEIRRNIESNAAKRRDTRDRIDAALTTDTAVEGMFLVDGSGESTKTVNFPAVFINRPSFQAGAELQVDTSPVAGSFPTMNCTIRRWITDPPISDVGGTVDYSKIYFVGAELLIVSTGPVAQRLWVHWRTSGRALVNPGHDSGSTTESLV